MIDGVLIERNEDIGSAIGDRNRAYQSRKYTFPNVPAGSTSDCVRFKVGERISIDYFKVYCLSTNYSIGIYECESLSGINLQLYMNAINQWVGCNTANFTTNGNSVLFNRDSPQQPYIYALLINSDLVNDTGTVYIEFFLSGN